jgi:hypothetical protein
MVDYDSVVNVELGEEMMIVLCVCINMSVNHDVSDGQSHLYQSTDAVESWLASASVVSRNENRTLIRPPGVRTWRKQAA